MDPFTVALAVFGIQKLRGQSTGSSFRDALLAATGTQLAGMAGVGAEGSAVGNWGSMAPQAFGSTSLGSTAGNFIPGADLTSQLGNTTVGKGITSLYGTPAKEAVVNPETNKIIEKAVPATGWQSFSPTEKLITGAVVAPTVAAAFQKTPKPEKAGYTEEEYQQAYDEQSKNLQGLGSTTSPTYSNFDIYNYGLGTPYRYNQGGIVNALPKFAVGGVNYMPSKISHDENDVNNYVRASGYVEDGSGTGDKDTDTILAQLADGEFVSRSDAVLGAGIMAGASPGNMREMRKLGASYFYDQQAKFKRIFDLLEASRKEKN